MIKGVNKQVLEIMETENGFFEKAIFFVKPEYTGMSEGRLRETAKNEINNIGTPPTNKFPRKSRMSEIALLAGCFFFGLIVGIVAVSL